MTLHHLGRRHNLRLQDMALATLTEIGRSDLRLDASAFAGALTF
jgi:hypothetical protein